MQTPIKPWLDKRLHFPFLKKGAMPSAADYPPTHNCTLIISYRTGGNNQLGPQEKDHQQFRYSATRNRAHRSVYPAWYPRLLRKRRRSAGVPGVAGSVWSGTDGRKGGDTIRNTSGHTQGYRECPLIFYTASSIYNPSCYAFTNFFRPSTPLVVQNTFRTTVLVPLAFALSQEQLVHVVRL